MSYAGAAHLHYFTIALLLGLLLAEFAQLRQQLSPRRGWALLFTDLAYGVSAGLVLTTGLIRLIWFGKGLDYYLMNSFFYLKMGLFLLVSMLSILRASLRAGESPRLDRRRLLQLRLTMAVELLALLGMVAAAALMARGHGQF
jgi:putative membrane protein